jgi:DMSO/TMAO reductase YedYZ heme-binding membrane subunit
MFQAFDKYVQYRKELGIITFYFVVAHAISSFFFLGEYFSRSNFIGPGLWPFIFGWLGVAVITFIFLISNSLMQNKLGYKRWWKMQYWGVRIVFILTALHVVVMKYPSWIKWYQVGGSQELAHPEWPGAGLLVAWFMAFVILVRLAETVNQRLGKIAWYMIVLGLPLVYIFTFIWGQQFAK